MDFERASTPIGTNGSRSELIYLDGMDYEDWIGSRFTFVHKDILVITEGCTRISEKGL